jgi:hypothetical protein
MTSKQPAGQPTTLGNMRALGVRGLMFLKFPQSDEVTANKHR